MIIISFLGEVLDLIMIALNQVSVIGLTYRTILFSLLFYSLLVGFIKIFMNVNNISSSGSEFIWRNIKGDNINSKRG